jgi:ATP synthase protein I
MPFHRPLPDSDSQSKVSSGVSAVITFEKGMQLALTLPSAVVIGWLIGAWADKHFHQEWISIAGIVFGAVSGLFYVIKTVLHDERNTRNGPNSQTDSGKGTGDQQK